MEISDWFPPTISASKYTKVCTEKNADYFGGFSENILTNMVPPLPKKNQSRIFADVCWQHSLENTAI